MRRDKYIILGKGASGKDWLCKKLEEVGYKKLVLYTTRPIRPNEKQDVDYHFVSKRWFLEHINEFVNHESFIGWFYGFTKKDLEECDVCVLPPRTLKKVLPYIKGRKIIYLDIDIETRKRRLSERYGDGNEDDKLERRIDADEKDFEHVYEDFDIWKVLKSEDDVNDFINMMI